MFRITDLIGYFRIGGDWIEFGSFWVIFGRYWEDPRGAACIGPAARGACSGFSARMFLRPTGVVLAPQGRGHVPRGGGA